MRTKKYLCLVLATCLNGMLLQAATSTYCDYLITQSRKDISEVPNSGAYMTVRSVYAVNDAAQVSVIGVRFSLKPYGTLPRAEWRQAIRNLTMTVGGMVQDGFEDACTFEYTAGSPEQTIWFPSGYAVGDELTINVLGWRTRVDGDPDGVGDGNAYIMTAGYTYVLGDVCGADDAGSAPVITSASLAQNSSTKVKIRVEASDNGGVDAPAYYSVEMDGHTYYRTLDAEGTLTIEGLTPKTVYTATIKAWDVAGNSSSAQTLKFRTTPLPTSEFCSTLIMDNNAAVSSYAYLTLSNIYDENKDVIGVIFELTPYAGYPRAEFRQWPSDLAIDGTPITPPAGNVPAAATKIAVTFGAAYPTGSVLTWSKLQWRTRNGEDPEGVGNSNAWNDKTAYSYTLGATCQENYISADIDGNTTCEGSPTVLTAVGFGNAVDGFEWYENIPSEGNNFTLIPGETSDQLTVVPDLKLKRYRAKHGAVESVAFELQGVVCCSTDDANYRVLWKEDFGTVAANKRVSNQYVVGHSFHDLVYTNGVINSNYSCLYDGMYAVVSNSSSANQNLPWPAGKTDHTGNTNGGYLIINVGEPNTSGTEFEQQILQVDVKEKFCEGLWYNFSMWATQISTYGKHPSSFILRIVELTTSGAEGPIIGEITTGEMEVFAMDRWVNYAISVSPGESVPGLRIKVYNLGLSGEGNDLAIDDLQFTSCAPVVSLYTDPGHTSTDIEIECGQKAHLYTEFDGLSSRYFSGTPYYLWQQSLDEGATWTTIANQADLDEYEAFAAKKEGTLFRCIVAGGPKLAEALAAGEELSDCDLYVITNTVRVTCDGGCQIPEVALDPESTILCGGGDAAFTLTVNGSDPIDQVVWEYQHEGAGWTTAETVNNPSSRTLTNTVAGVTASVLVRATVTSGTCPSVVNGSVRYVDAAPSPVVDNLERCMDAQASQAFQASIPASCDLVWYDAQTAVTPLTAVPTTSLATPGVYSAWVAGRYKVEPYCETDKQEVTITVHDLPDADITASEAFFTCSHQPITLQAVTSVTGPVYQWSTGATTESVETTTEGGYRVTVTDPSTGCSFTSNTLQLEVHEDNLSVFLEADRDQVKLGEGILLTLRLVDPALKVGTVSWYHNGEMLQQGTGLSLMILPYDSGEYEVVAEGECNEARATYSVEVVWPTVFTPYDGNGKNTTFVTNFAEAIPLLVYDRFGNKLADTENGWDGRTGKSSAMSAPGVYYYVATLPDGSKRRGTVEIYK